jgi:hypothetical protein
MLLRSSQEFIKANDLPDDALSILFLLLARLCFKKLYEGELGRMIVHSDYKGFTNRVAHFRQLSPSDFGITENFLPHVLLSVPLAEFPDQNPYKDTIALFERLTYYICPIDFCMNLHVALRRLQNIASSASFEYVNSRGTLSAKRDHLLCTDDLVDISTVIFLLGNPVPVSALVQAFEPFIHGLEMTSELEFAFTSISAIVTRLLELDVDSFMQEARAKAEAASDVDPLLGPGSCPF